MVTGKNKFNTFCVGQTKKEELYSTASLLIESEIDQLSYAILNNANSQCIGLCALALESSMGRMERRDLLKDIFAENEVLNFPFSKRSVLMSNRECVFIPEQVFHEDDLKYYIDASFGDNFKGECFATKIPELKNYIVFKIPDWLISIYREKLSGATIQHSTAFLVGAIYRLSRQRSETIIHAHFKRSFFELLIFKQGKMLFYNSFSYQTSEDIAYFIMYALQQWELEGNEMSVSGLLNADSEELFWLRKYLGEIKEFPAEELLSFPPALETPSLFLNLLNPSHCE